MEIQILALLNGKEKCSKGNLTLHFQDRDFSGFSVPEPVLVSYHAGLEAEQVVLRLSIRTKISAECARCLAPILKEWELEKEYSISRDDLREEYPELPFSGEGVLDLDELVYGELVLEVDSILLCTEDCEGLCPDCGQPKADCQCQSPPSQGDPRWQVLKQLLEEQP